MFATAAALVVSPAAAAPMCVSGTLSTYLAAGFECEIDQAVFGNFSFQTQGGLTVPHLTADEITVSPISGPNQVGLRFSGDFEAQGGPNGPGPAEGIRIAAYRFLYDVTRANSEFFSATTNIDPNYTFVFFNPLKFGGILAGKSIANDGALASALINSSTTMPSDATLLNTPRQSISVDDLFQLSGGASAAGTAAPVGFVSAGYMENVFEFEEIPIPEPSSWTMLLGAGALLLGLRRRLGS